MAERSQWDGTERRVWRDDEREGRRSSDMHCGDHHLLWKHHDEEKTDHRTIVCGKISKLERGLNQLAKSHSDDIAAMTPWKTFSLALGFVGACFAGLFWLTYSGQEKILERMSKNDAAAAASVIAIERSISEIKYGVDTIREKVRRLEQVGGIAE